MEFSKVSSWCLDVGLVHCFWNGNSLGPSVLGPVTKHVFCLRACLSLDVSHHRKMSWKKKNAIVVKYMQYYYTIEMFAIR